LIYDAPTTAEQAMRNEASEPATAPARSAPPRHIAIIMDGNGRWAAARGLLRLEGHRRGVEALRRAVRAAGELGVSYLTVYSFSSENWRRPPQEISDLMGLMKLFIRNDLADLHASGVRVRIIGARDNLAPDIRSLLVEAEELTRDNTKLNLTVAFNYGSRQEIAQAARKLAQAVAEGKLDPALINENMIDACLDTQGVPDPDLIIRTSGEQRLSNFLLWQAAYAEFVFLPGHWPDFDRAALEEAIGIYQSRDRRYGAVSPQGIVKSSELAGA
jgi:undecaprenyl diphosphate synthase